MKKLDFIKNWQFAHRGLHNKNIGIPENSYSAFSLAVEKGYGIELDIAFLDDGTMVCFHDSNLKRMTSIDASIHSYNYIDLKPLRLESSNESIPLFLDVIKHIDSKVPVLIEVKSRKNIKKYLPILTNVLDTYQGEFAVFSFDPKIVYWLKKHRKHYIRGQITSFFYENKVMPKFVKFLMKTLFFNKFTTPDFISYNHENLPNKYANKAKQRGLVVISYTARNQSEYDKVLKSYDNVVFENFIPVKTK